MKTMFLAFFTLIAVAFVADRALDYAGFSAADRTSGDSVRLN